MKINSKDFCVPEGADVELWPEFLFGLGAQIGAVVLVVGKGVPDQADNLHPSRF